MCRITATLGSRLNTTRVNTLAEQCYGGSAVSTEHDGVVEIMVPDAAKEAMTRLLSANGAHVVSVS